MKILKKVLKIFTKLAKVFVNTKFLESVLKYNSKSKIQIQGSLTKKICSKFPFSFACILITKTKKALFIQHI